MRRPRSLALLGLLLAVTLVPACSGGTAEVAIKKPENVAKGPETLAAAPTAVVEDTPSWTELPKPVADAFGGKPEKGKFQAFAAMKTSTVSVQLSAVPDDKTVFKALDAATAFVPEDYTILLNVYAPGAEGKPAFTGYEWTPLQGTLVKKTSADADQSWNAAITAVTAGSATGMLPTEVKRIASGESQPPLFAP